MIMAMSKAIALSRVAAQAASERQLEIIRCLIVLGCGAALALAGPVLPV